MNIIEAMTLAQSGAHVRLPSWAPGVYVHCDDNGGLWVTVPGHPKDSYAPDDVDEVLATDWEVAQRPHRFGPVEPTP